jgi:hypothetical protein
MSSSNNPNPLPSWLIGLGSVVIAGHLLALAISVLAAISGPWPTPYGGDTAPAPAFASCVDTVVRPHYLQPLKLTHNYHFDTNRAEQPGIYFKVQLKSASGETVATLKFPEDDANPWVRHRQGLLALRLGSDQPVQLRPGEGVAAQGQHVRTIQFWKPAPDRSLSLVSKPEHLVRDEGPVSRPSDLSLVLVRSYVRYLCRTHGAAFGEITRYSRDPISPVVVLQRDIPPGPANDELVAHYGEFPK